MCCYILPGEGHARDVVQSATRNFPRGLGIGRGNSYTHADILTRVYFTIYTYRVIASDGFRSLHGFTFLQLFFFNFFPKSSNLENVVSIYRRNLKVHPQFMYMRMTPVYANIDTTQFIFQFAFIIFAQSISFLLLLTHTQYTSSNNK